MKKFSLLLQSPNQSEIFDDVVSFTGKDSSGSFSILAHHARFMTSLDFGLAKFEYSNGKKEYLALPGGVLYFVDNQLKVATRHYLRSDDYQVVTNQLEKQLLIEETDISNIKETLHNIDEKVLRRLWNLKREGEI